MDQSRTRDDAQTLRYLADMLGQLRQMLPAANAPTLHYLIGMAQLEAERQLRHRP